MATTLDFEDEGGDDTSSVTICSTSSIHPQTMHYNNRKLEANASSCNNCCAAIIDHHHRHNPHDINNEAAIEKTTVESQRKDRSMDDDCNENMGCGSTIDNVGLANQVETAATIVAMKTASQRQQPPHLQQHVVSTQPEAQIASNALSVNKNLLLCRRFKDSGDTLRNFNSLPLFVYATSPSTHAVSADGVGVAKVAVKAAEEAAKSPSFPRPSNQFLRAPKRGNSNNKIPLRDAFIWAVGHFTQKTETFNENWNRLHTKILKIQQIIRVLFQQ
uniref:Uncharacterized protein n=1 Tax=Glossina austeni TaxID=7395 RepID=A0A1A9UXG1_GLOAU